VTTIKELILDFLRLFSFGYLCGAFGLAIAAARQDAFDQYFRILLSYWDFIFVATCIAFLGRHWYFWMLKKIEEREQKSEETGD
jgi:hypothetical protein